MTPTLHEAALEYAEDRTVVAANRALMTRAYMAGALAALTSKTPRDQLLRECVDYGRTVGTALETATVQPRTGRADRCPHGVSELNRCARCG